MLDREVPVGRKLFEETDKPTESKIIFENKEEGIVERESTWTGEFFFQYVGDCKYTITIFLNLALLQLR